VVKDEAETHLNIPVWNLNFIVAETTQFSVSTKVTEILQKKKTDSTAFVKKTIFLFSIIVI
jgi:hypothetical protein